MCVHRVISQLPQAEYVPLEVHLLFPDWRRFTLAFLFQLEGAISRNLQKLQEKRKKILSTMSSCCFT